MLARHLQPILEASLADFPVVLLLGARQVGKTTLAQSLPKRSWPARYLTLDDRTTLDAALVDPEGLLAELAGPAILDEVQRAPDLLRAVKQIVDRDREPGRFLLTGSANVITLSAVSETLAGRVAVHELQPLTWTERFEDPAASLLEDLFAASSARELVRRWSRRPPPGAQATEIRNLVLTGGYPTPALAPRAQTRRTWFESYRKTYVERDLRDIASIEHLPDFGRLMTTVALRTGQILNASELSRDVGMPLSTLRRYFNILLQTFQVHLVHPYSANVRKRLVKTPKIYWSDTGMAAHLSAVDRWETLVRQNRVGAMVETWAVNELRKLASLAAWRTDLWYWRTQTGEEVDVVLERGGEVVGVEIKWGAGFSRRDLAGLEGCRAALGKSWRHGILVHGGSETLALDEQTIAVPFATFFGRSGEAKAESSPPN